MSRPLAPDRGDPCAIGFDELHERALCSTDPHYVPAASRCQPDQAWFEDWNLGFRQRGEYHFRRMRNDGEQRPRRSARRALALFPIPDGFDGHAEPCGELLLG